MTKELIEEASIETLNIYDVPNFYNELKPYVNKIIEKINKGDKNLKEICEDINCFIRNLFNKDISIKSKQIKLVAKGSSSICYHSVYETNEHLYLYKVFSPFSFCCNIPYEQVSDIRDHFCLIPDCAEYEHRRRILRRFVRFIRQIEEIDLCRQGVRVKENLFETPKLMFSSKGFVYEVELYIGSCTLEEEFRSFQNDCNVKNFKNIIKLVREAAEQVRNFCHKPEEHDEKNKIFHGDIKPENFLKIYTQKSANEYFLRNIDFDTWIRYGEIEAGFLKEFAATTRLYYDFNENTNPDSIKSWFSYDIKALGRMLIYALSLMAGYDIHKYGKTRVDFDWENFFFESNKTKAKDSEQANCPAKKIFELLNADKNLSDLFIFEQLRDLLLRCENYGIKDINEFIVRLDNIERLKNNNPKDSIDDIFFRYVNLRRLDEEIEKGIPFARQCIFEFLVEEDTETGKKIVANYNYDTLSGFYKDFNPDAKKEMIYHHLEFNFVEQVLNKAFKKEADGNK